MNQTPHPSIIYCDVMAGCALKNKKIQKMADGGGGVKFASKDYCIHGCGFSCRSWEVTGSQINRLRILQQECCIYKSRFSCRPQEVRASKSTTCSVNNLQAMCPDQENELLLSVANRCCGRGSCYGIEQT